MPRAGFNFALLFIVDAKFKNLASLAQLAKFLYYFSCLLFFSVFNRIFLLILS